MNESSLMQVDLTTIGLATTFMLSVATPALISAATPWLDAKLPAVLRSPIKTIVAVVITAACTAFGFWLDGDLTWPLSDRYWMIMLGAFGLQQLVYGTLKSTLLNGVANIVREWRNEPPATPVKKRKPRKPSTRTLTKAK